MTSIVLQQFGFSDTDYTLNQHGNGLINLTWLVEKKSTSDKFILQQINNSIFKSPEAIDFNIRLIDEHLAQFQPEYIFVAPLQTVDKKTLLCIDNNYFRMFPFVKDSHSIDTVQKPEQAYEAARQFALFTKSLSGLDAGQLKITLPDFHNLSLRYQQFEKALILGDKQRLKQSRDLINFIQQHRSIAGEFEYNKPDLITRCTHHDTKISNVLFDQNDKGICVIDLDTVMPGYFISDVGDMMRTYLAPVNEEATDFSTIEVRPAYYQAIVDGYMCEMGGELNDLEKDYFHFAGKFMIYMQALRFLTDHINNDVYYGSRYQGHNLVRAGNQAALLQKLIAFNPR